MTRKDSEVVFALLAPRTILNAKGQFKGGFFVLTDITRRKRAEQRQAAMAEGLHAVVAAADELIACADLDTVFRRVVELARERLGVERCAIYLQEGSELHGTYGTDRHGQTTPQHSHRFSTEDPDWQERLRLMHPERRRWIAIDGEHTEWDGEKMVRFGQGWVALTPIRSHLGWKRIGVLFNDAAVSGTALDETKQELLTVFCSILANIVERKRAEEALRASEWKYRQLYENSLDGVVSFDMEGNFLECNSAFQRMLGYTVEELRRMTSRDVTPEKWHKWEGQFVQDEIIPKGYSGPYEKEYVRKDGTVFPVEQSAYLIRCVEGQPQEMCAFARDITERNRMESELRSLSVVDELTGLYNRRGFLAFAEREFRMTRRKEKGMLLLFADLDRMKWINDTLGHPEGDSALVETASVLKEAFRESDIVGRYGGDEFVVLTIESGDDCAAALGARLDERLAAHNRNSSRPYALALSVGIARHDPQDPCSLHELLARADRLMYEHKKAKANGDTG